MIKRKARRDPGFFIFLTARGAALGFPAAEQAEYAYFSNADPYRQYLGFQKSMLARPNGLLLEKAPELGAETIEEIEKWTYRNFPQLAS